MFGFLRLTLAACVVLFHAGNSPFGVRMGVSAVIIFFMLSGYAMSGLYSSRFGTLKNAHHFYIERVIRIAPQYYFYLILTFIMLFGFELWFSGFPARKLEWVDVFSNITLIPMGLTIYFPALLNFALIGQAVSLANEMIFYLLVPIIFVYRLSTVLACVVSLVLFCLATQSEISIVAYSYNYLPGPLIFFIIGHFLYKKAWLGLAGSVVPLLVNQIILIQQGEMKSGFNLDIYIGLWVGLMTIYLLMHLKPNKIDHILGNASYGCFLGHYVMLIAFRHYHIFDNNLLMFSVSLLSISILAGFISHYLVEFPTIRYRHFWRNKNLMFRPD
jgi:peptidoglycan/LPS O-acetylase OafA/YrhL